MRPIDVNTVGRNNIRQVECRLFLQCQSNRYCNILIKKEINDWHGHCLRVGQPKAGDFRPQLVTIYLTKGKTSCS